MPVIDRHVTRTIFNATESTRETRTHNTDALAFVMVNAVDNFYVGFKHPFASRYFNFGTLNATPQTITVKYWDGDSFEVVEDVIDQTAGFTQNGFLSWENKDDWREVAQTPVDDEELFWIQISVSGTMDGGTTLQSLPNLFCDDNLVKVYYPEFLSDSRYLPSNRTDFIEQYEAAKNLVVLRLKQDGIIKDEGDIIDINEVAISTVHAFAWTLLNPIAVDEGDVIRASAAFDNFNRELNKVRLDLDFDNSGIITDRELNEGNVFIKRS